MFDQITDVECKITASRYRIPDLEAPIHQSRVHLLSDTIFYSLFPIFRFFPFPESLNPKSITKKPISKHTVHKIGIGRHVSFPQISWVLGQPVNPFETMPQVIWRFLAQAGKDVKTSANAHHHGRFQRVFILIQKIFLFGRSQRGQ